MTLTAKEARDIAKAKDPAFAVELILKDIEKAAKDGQYIFTTRDYGFGSGGYYCSEDKYPALGKAILKALREFGYKAEVRVQELQFVDMWLEVSWKDAA